MFEAASDILIIHREKMTLIYENLESDRQQPRHSRSNGTSCLPTQLLTY